MRSIRPLTALLLCSALLLTTTGFDSCERKGTPDEQKAEFISYAKDIHQAFVAAGPLIAQLKPNLKSKWDKGTVIAGHIITAVEATNETEVSKLLVELIPIFTEVAAEFTDNTKVLVVLLLADIGLRFFANHYKVTSEVSGRSASAGGARVRAFANRPKWRCRSAASGRFVKMDFCRAFPDKSVVETQ